MKNRSLIIATLLIAIAGFHCKREQYWQPDRKFANLQQTQPGFQITDLPEQVETLVINLFAPNCPPCIEELPELQKLYEKSQADEKLKFIAIGSHLDTVADLEISRSDIIKTVGEFVQNEKIQYPVYIADQTDIRALRVTGFPETFVLHRDKKSKFGWRLQRKFISARKLEQVLETPRNRSIYE